MKKHKYTWPSGCYGRTRPKRKCPNGYEVIYSSNFRTVEIFRIIRNINAFKKSGKGYVILDRAFNIHNRWMPFYTSVTVFIKKEYTDTAQKRHNEYMQWIK